MLILYYAKGILGAELRFFAAFEKTEKEC